MPSDIKKQNLSADNNLFKGIHNITQKNKSQMKFIVFRHGYHIASGRYIFDIKLALPILY